MSMKSKIITCLTTFVLLFSGLNSMAQRATYVIVHGAWGGAWQFKETANELEKKGHKIHRLTLTGLGERYHLADTSIRLQTHINDAINTILFEDLNEIILVGHSYGGMIITAVADSLPSRIKKLIYLDAILPEDQESVMSLMVKPQTKSALVTSIKDSFILPFWVKDQYKFPRDVPHPLSTVNDKIHLKNPKRHLIPTVYILTYESEVPIEKDAFYPFYKRAKKRNFKTVELVADHNPQVKKLKELVYLLDQEKL